MFPGQDQLTPKQNEALVDASVQLIEACLADLERFAIDPRIPDDVGALVATCVFDPDVLPPRFRTLYDRRFVERFLAVLMTLSWKLKADESFSLTSVAEEMALAATIKIAQDIHNALWELTEGEFELRDLGDTAFEDTDFEMLWADELDGVQDSDIGRAMGVGGLNLSEWFQGFAADRGPAHPFAAD